MNSPHSTRRRFLGRAGGALLAAGAATTGGCSELLPPLGSRVRYGRVDVPATTGPAYRRWLPAASALPADDLDPGYVNHVTPGALGQDVVGTANRDPHFFQKPYLDHFGVGYENYDRVVGLHRTTRSTYVLEGDVDPATASATLVESGYAPAGSHAGYDLFDRPDGPRTAAVSPAAIVWAHHDESAAIVEAVIDAERGAVDRHHEVDDAFARATDAIGASPWTMLGGLGIDPTGDALVRSMSYAVDPRGVYYTHRALYPAGTVVSERALREALEGHSRAVDGRAVDLRVRDRLATVEMHLPHSSLRTDYATATVPQITWGISQDDGTMTVRHESGETPLAATITVSIEGADGRSPAETQFADDHERIRPGDSITIATPEDAGISRIVGTFSPVDAGRSCQFVLSEFP